jgi:hypothetical protein
LIHIRYKSNTIMQCFSTTVLQNMVTGAVINVVGSNLAIIESLHFTSCAIAFSICNNNSEEKRIRIVVDLRQVFFNKV